MKHLESTEDFEFYKEVVSHITASLDLSSSMVALFDYLKDYFPIEGISLHQFCRRLSALKLLFLVTAHRFDYVESILHLSPGESRRMIQHESNEDPVLFGEKDGGWQVTRAHRKAISHLLPYKPPAYMIGIMHAGKTPIGHLCFIGKNHGCFTGEHIRKMRLLLGPFTMAMANMLQFKRVSDFQQKLYAEKSSLQEELRQLQDSSLIGAQGGLLETMKVVEQLKDRETPVLILGETGTGKELIADTIQKMSPRADKPFIKINCGAIPESLIDSELFGYEKGAFTGATRSHPGRFEQADGGTLFLDEVGELSPSAQVHLLRVLESNEVDKLGCSTPVSVDVRIIAATNRKVETMLSRGAFREDLFFRLFVFPVYVPPLRERTQDIPALIHFFVQRICARLGIAPPPVLHPDSLPRLMEYSWPGNVRELENLVERAVILSKGEYLNPEKYLPQDHGWYLKPGEQKGYLEELIDQQIDAKLNGDQVLAADKGSVSGKVIQDGSRSPVRSLDDIVREGIEEVLGYCRGRVNGPQGAAELLKVNASTLRNKMRKLGIDPGAWRSSRN